jgi:hypothetical protein
LDSELPANFLQRAKLVQKNPNVELFLRAVIVLEANRIFPLETDGFLAKGARNLGEAQS